VDLNRSTFRISPDNKAFVPGDEVGFRVCAADVAAKPVAGLPVVVVVEVQQRIIAGDGTALTGPDGCVDLSYTVQEIDMVGDPDNGEADSGSYILIAYIGGRMLNTVKILHDTQ
jgi:hypothetical protein